ncbi:MAG: response regulator transcription factor [Saprospiraceae bacterium]|nr:response regulator transcription factor [Saprospiraceae bacterium]
MEKITVAILEDLADVAAILKDNLNSEDDLVCEHIYGNAEDAIHFFPHHKTKIFIVDIGLPRASGIEAITTLSSICPETEFCIFTVYEDDDKIFQSLQAGAKGYILKSAPPQKIIEAVRELHQGGSPMSPHIARRVIDVFRQTEVRPAHKELPITQRETELLTLLAKGLLYKEIADKMGITIGTVKQHIHKIYEKLQVSNRTEAINRLK